MRPPKSLPNLLTLSRIGLTVPLAYYLFKDRIGVALGILVIAAVTDFLDGLIAREFGLRTVLGSWLDPAADKIMITTVLVVLTLKRDVPVWYCLTTLSRDITLVVGAMVLVLKGVDVKIRPLLTGKMATVGQNATLLMAILARFAPVQLAFHAVMAASTALTIVSFVTYARQFFKLALEFENTDPLSP
jgi:cardiolipin synthase